MLLTSLEVEQRLYTIGVAMGIERRRLSSRA
jgi:hypothetical protein